jgi:hypothetical protein
MNVIYGQWLVQGVCVCLSLRYITGVAPTLPRVYPNIPEYPLLCSSIINSARVSPSIPDYPRLYSSCPELHRLMTHRRHPPRRWHQPCGIISVVIAVPRTDSLSAMRGKTKP